MSEKQKSAFFGNPWLFVPALYFLEGLPYFVVNAIPAIIFKKMGIPNDELIEWTTLVTWPWTLKMFWSPWVDSISTRRKWVIGTQLLCLLGVFAFAWVQTGTDPWNHSLIILAILALGSATHDVAADGFYLTALNHSERSFFVGIRSTFYRISRVFVTGAVVWYAGSLEENGMASANAWKRALLMCAGVYIVTIVLGALTMSKPAGDLPKKSALLSWGVVREYFDQPHIAIVIFFILFYRFGESMVGVMSSPFFLDSHAAGGLALSTVQVGQVGGVVGVIGLILGGISGGIVLSKFGLKKSFLPMIFSMYIPNLFYLWASIVKPEMWGVRTLVFVDQFGYGFGFSAYMVFLMFIAQNSKFKTAHYAISTGLMALGAFFASFFSGKIYKFFAVNLGEGQAYIGFFLVTFLICIPGLLIIRKLPLEGEDVFEGPQGAD